MTVWHAFTAIQADAVHATAAQHLRDPEDLAAELAPLFTREPANPPGDTQEPRTVVFEGNTVAERGWSLLGLTESGFPLYVRPSAGGGSIVNDPLTTPSIGASQ